MHLKTPIGTKGLKDFPYPRNNKGTTHIFYAYLLRMMTLIEDSKLWNIIYPLDFTTLMTIQSHDGYLEPIDLNLEYPGMPFIEGHLYMGISIKKLLKKQKAKVTFWSPIRYA